MKPNSWQSTLGALALLLATNVSVAGPDTGAVRGFRVELAGEAYRLELSGALTAPNGPFEARMFRLGIVERAGNAGADPALVITPLPVLTDRFASRAEPDAVWTVSPHGATTGIVIRVGPDRLEGLFPAFDGPVPAKSGVCGPDDVIIPPLWVEANGVPVDVPDMAAHVQEGPPAPKTDRLDRWHTGAGSSTDHVPFEDPQGFLRGFGQLHGMVLATLGPTTTDIADLAKGRCMGPCLSCAAGILRMTSATALMTASCASALASGGGLTAACAITFLYAHSSVLEAGISCGECDHCRSHGQGSSSGPVCNCPCMGEPTCDCAEECSGQEPQEGPDEELP